MDNEALERFLERVFELLAVGVPTGLFGHWIAGRRDKRVDAQTLIDQVQEERNRMDEALKERDEKIDRLYEDVNALRKQVQEVLHENRVLKWELEKRDLEIDTLKKENERLRTTEKYLREQLEERVEKDDRVD